MFEKQALISVFNKKEVGGLAKEFRMLNIEIISSGETAVFLQNTGIKVTEISEITNFPEMLNGRVKTLHPIVHAGILAERNKKLHMRTLRKHNIKTIDFVVCNLYPFEQTISKPEVTIKKAIENIDIGRPTLIRAAAKNYQDVVVLTNPKQYKEVIETLKSGKDLNLEQRKRLALEAFSHTAQYDTIISNYLRNKWLGNVLPENLTITMRKVQDVRHGENKHQEIASFYETIPKSNIPCITSHIQYQGKELSFNNISDADTAIETVKEFNKPSCVIIKHNTPCGIATAEKTEKAWRDALATDTYSPFGGVVAFNREVTRSTLREINKAKEDYRIWLEVLIAPSYSPQVRIELGKKKNLRVLVIPELHRPYKRDGFESRSVTGGYLFQEKDIWLNKMKNWKIVTKRKPSEEDLNSMQFAVKCIKHVKSNSVLFVKDTRTVAIGGGQTSRVDAVWISTHKGKENIKNSIMASDAFFPLRDGIDVAAKAGVKVIIQPGGSIRDKEVIQAANEHKIAMVFSGQRYFKH